LWQWWAPQLWRRFTIALRRRLAARLGVTETAARGLVRVQFAKVAEYQRRGIIHFHALIRLDGPPADGNDYPPPRVELDAETLAELAREAAGAVSFRTPGDQGLPVRELRFGRQIDAQPVHHGQPQNAGAGQPVDDDGVGELGAEVVAAYIAKYATKATDDLDPGQAGQISNPHIRRIRTTVDQLADQVVCHRPKAPYRLLGRWRHMLGFRGHFATKSRTYSVTLGSIRAERRRHQAHHEAEAARSAGDCVDELDETGEGSTLVVGSWRFAGMGWLTDGDAALAAASAARARAHRQQRAAARRLPAAG
jgi:hypothetical protein